MNITIYGKPDCQWCEAAKQLCTRLGYEYKYVDIFQMESFLEWRDNNAPGMKTVPIIVVDGRTIGGYEAFAHMVGDVL